ncbi:FAD/NAD(P)-binding domain-containing protein [Mesorhizobium sp. BR115XR7A]|uniref:FAD/NAD(P)-binding protein n=1 Tax=Mesorhizobium sp. BR115XR7A TaxID=2876645 RepID=UPI001CC94AAD|nr:FAD/NAD(P)-binding protein [Mesorhizobium sp. BR115XR7A]MBZ9907483.1 FAD/NAD(P)-binding domain-containing protein [Mesorhizobium sp. BR115XR7A]MBZ9929345.1 FAD/NAD(P)-binding domain-containing protein [Mesorhizobium sp. BR1-1-5]
MNALPPVRRSRVAIIGGGFSGAAVAWHLARAHRPERLSISVIEPRSALGGGLAYSSDEPSHRVNVPAVRMSMVPEDQQHFARWLAGSGEIERDPDALWKNGDVFPRRRVFGRYVAEQLAPWLDSGAIRHVEAQATRVIRANGAGWTVQTLAGPVAADILVLAATHPLPAIPAALALLAEAPGFIADPYAPSALAGIGPEASVLIVGSGLTSADMVAELDRRGHRGRILALSRRGLRSRAHPDIRHEPFGDFASVPATSALGLLKNIRATLAAARAANVNWQSVFDQLRMQGPVLWSALAPPERARLVRQLRVFWDVHRFRIAPQVASVLDRRQTAGTFDTIAARLVASNDEGDSLAVSFQRRGQTHIETASFDAVINTTGPAHGQALQSNPALRSLTEASLIRADAYGLGIETGLDSRAVGGDDKAVAGLFVAGPLARGTFGELMGLPEVARHAQRVSAEIAGLLDTSSSGGAVGPNAGGVAVAG